MEYLLITFYNRGTITQPSWDVFGHTAPYVNEFLHSFPLKSQAIEYAHTLGCPVLQGTNKENIVQLLQGG